MADVMFDCIYKYIALLRVVRDNIQGIPPKVEAPTKYDFGRNC